MKLQLLRQVKDAEQTGAQSIADAEAKAAQIVADARREAETIVNDGKANADLARQDKLDAARKAVADEAQGIIAEGESKAAGLRERFDGATDGVTDRVLKIIEESL